MTDDSSRDLSQRRSKQQVAENLRRIGYPQTADEALRVLPAQMDLHEAQKFARERGIFYDDLISRMGGSP